MSLRRKLILFFLAMAVVPIALLAYLLIDVSADARKDQAEADLRAGMLSVGSLYEVAGVIAPDQADRIARRLASPLGANDAERVARIAEQELGSRVVAGITVRDESGRVVEDVGPALTLVTARQPVRGPSGRKVGSVEVTTIDTNLFLSRIEAQTNQTAAILKRGEVIASTDPVAIEDANIVSSTPDELTSFEVDASTGYDLGAALDLAWEPGDTRLLLLTDSEGTLYSHPFTVIGALALLLIGSLAVAALVLNRLRRRLNDMLDMTRRIGQGDFSGELSEDGNDEMAKLACEINRMRRQIATQMQELRSQRRELDESVRRLGDAFASGLDRQALLEVLIETATAACNAELGEIRTEGEEGRATISAGARRDDLEELLAQATARAIEENSSAHAADPAAGTHAMAEVMADHQRPRDGLSVVALARSGPDFTDGEREALRYLIGQCAISIENIALHERLAMQAVTDPLTGLANHRALTAWIEREVQRVHRYGDPLSMLMMDIDEFKRINDGLGHPRGDEVLRAVADVIRRESREIDEAARYGGDEFVLALPGTDAAGAAEVAERIRRGVAAIELEPDGSGEDDDCEGVEVSVSIGVAATDSGVATASALIKAADDALYAAKLAGKDRVSTATGS